MQNCTLSVSSHRENQTAFRRINRRQSECDLTDILYQRDREFIAFVRPDLAVSGMGSSFAVRAADIRAMSAA